MTATAPPRARPGTGEEDRADVNRLVSRWRRHRDWAARDELIRRFLPLARRLAGRYTNPYEPLEDMIQVACVGLIGAIDRFDPDRGTSFRAFAIPTILGELKRYFRNTGWSAHVPRGAQELALRVDGAARQITEQTGRAPGVGRIAEFMELSVDDVLMGLEAGSAHYSMSLDAPSPAGEAEEPQTLGDSLGAQDERYALIETKLSLTAAIARLPHLERQALSLRIDHQLKQTEIAARLGCSQMQVSRLLRRAAGRLADLADPGPAPRSAP